MATQILHIKKFEKNKPEHPDGKVTDRENNPVGGAWNMDGPTPWLKIQLKPEWCLVSTEELKKLQTAQKELNKILDNADNDTN